MNIEFFNCPPPEQFDTKILPTEKPAFIGYRPDMAALEALAKEYEQYQNVLVIGHGGSVTSFAAMYGALRQFSNADGAHVRGKRAWVLSSVDPDYIAELKQELKATDTLVLAISKSGADTTQLEAFSQFLDYPAVVITAQGSAEEQVAQKLNLTVVRHPEIGGRFTAFTEVGLLPAALCGLDVKGLLRGAGEMYALYEKENLAWKAASVLWQLEKQGYVDVLGLVYSHYLHATSSLLTQLCHEGFGKEGKGQTYVFAEGSEVQHHTVQRLLGGRQNMAAWFVGLHGFHAGLETHFPPAVHGVAFRGQALFDLQRVPLQESQRFELQGTMEAARMAGLPVAHMELAGLEPVSLGRFIAFWQLFAVYSSMLRGVDPFDQPEVEHGKQMSFNKRLEYKGLL